ETVLTNGSTSVMLVGVEQEQFADLTVKIGSTGNDFLSGAGIFGYIGGPGGGTIIGNFSANDVASFSGDSSAYSVTDNHNDTYTVTGPDGVDLISGVSRLLFNDGIALIQGSDMPGINTITGTSGNDILTNSSNAPFTEMFGLEG